ncbi:MAG: GNAT family N-acetyltransferase [Acidimicrobiia bacterium]
MFTPIRTRRLLIRPFEPTDAAGSAARRNDPEVAKYQDWELPYTLERAEKRISELVAMTGPEKDQTWSAIVADGDNSEVYGDLALHLSADGHTAEVGYTFAREYWGQGYAVEALEALLEFCFDHLQVTRVFGMLHPDNPASAMVMERTGFLFEGHTKASFWLGDENSDDWIYGLIRPDWEIWRNRPRHPPKKVDLIEITVGNQPQVSKLATHKTQERFVATMADSFTDALFPEIVDGYPAVPWMRAVAADGEIVGFVMLALPHEHSREPYLWRLLIDRLHQRRGIGERVLELLIAECRSLGAETLLISWETGKGSPAPFYLSNGFEPTGRMLDVETEARKRF